MDTTRLLTRLEVRRVAADLRRRHQWRLLALFRLSACCGLRASEIAGLNTDDLRVHGDRPVVVVRSGKGARPRSVPLWWDRQTLLDLREWQSRQGTRKGPLLVTHLGTRPTRLSIWRWWRQALAVLPEERRSRIRVHDGRHTFATRAAHKHALAAVRDALGHSSISTTSVYLHAEEDDGKIGSMW